MISKYLSLFIMFVLTTFSFTFANAKPSVGQSYSGSASYYGKRHHGNKTASGERFNMYGMTAAHRSLPLGCKIRVTNQENGKSVIVKVNDRGPFHGNRILDLSQGAAKQLGFIKQGLAKIDIEVLSIPDKSKKVTNVQRYSTKNQRVNNTNSQRISPRINATEPVEVAGNVPVINIEPSITKFTTSYDPRTPDSIEGLLSSINTY